MAAATTCPGCRAVGCEARFHACLVADFSDPTYGIVHHLVVAAYGLQHGWYTEQATPWMVEFVRSHLDREPTDHDRRDVRRVTDGAMQVRARASRVPHVPWAHSIADVDVRSAEAYVSTVRTWAGSVARSLDEAAAASEAGER
jgi:hypothetical protein